MFFRLLRTYRKTALGLICVLTTLLVLILYLCAIGFGIRIYDFKLIVEPVTWLREVNHVENKTKDLRARYGTRSPRRDDLVYMSIDEPSISLTAAWPEEIAASRALTLIDETGWPFNREVYGHIIERLMEAGARLIVIDLLFTGPKDGDDYLREVLRKYGDRIVLGANYVYKETSAGAGAGAEILQAPSPSLFFSPEEMETRANQITRGELEESLDPRIAFVNFFPNTDDVIRQAIFEKKTTIEGQPILSLAAHTMQSIGREDLLPQNRLNEPIYFRLTGPKFSRNNIETGFRPYSVYEIFLPTLWKSNYGDGAFFKDKIVLLGPEGNFHQDMHETSFQDMPGPEIHLNVMNALFNQDFLRQTTPGTDILAILGAGFVAWCFLVIFKSPQTAWIMFLTADVGYLALSMYFYNEQGLYILVVPPLLALNLSGAAGTLTEYVNERMERARTRATLERFVSKDIVREVLDARESFYNTMGGARRTITVLFSDVRGFTTYTEVTPGDVVVSRLNEYLTEMTEAVWATNGTLDKFIGDAVMAEWGNIPMTSTGAEDEARRAVETAITMRRKLEALNAKWKQEKGYEPWAFGIGIHQGDAIVGSIGSINKQDPTVIGDTVNTGARLESFTKQYQVDLLMSETVAPHVAKDYLLRSVDKVVFKGKTKAVEIFTIVAHRLLPLDAKRQQVLDAFEEGIKLFRPPARDFAAAQAKFEAGLAIDPEDFLCALYIQRAKEFLETPPPPDWQGEEVAKTK